MSDNPTKNPPTKASADDQTEEDIYVPEGARVQLASEETQEKFADKMKSLDLEEKEVETEKKATSIGL